MYTASRPRRAEAAHFSTSRKWSRRRSAIERPLPSFCTFPRTARLAPGAMIPLEENPPDTAGLFPRNHVAKVRAGRCRAQVVLCHPGGTAPRGSPVGLAAGVGTLPSRSSARYLTTLSSVELRARPGSEISKNKRRVTVPRRSDDVGGTSRLKRRSNGAEARPLWMEPQAAFSTLLGSHSPPRRLARALMRCLVWIMWIGVTSDFSLIRAGEEKSELRSSGTRVRSPALGGDKWTSRWRKPSRQSCPAAGSTRRSSGRWCRRVAAKRRCYEPRTSGYPVRMAMAVACGRHGSVTSRRKTSASLFDGFFPHGVRRRPNHGVPRAFQEWSSVGLDQRQQHLAAFRPTPHPHTPPPTSQRQRSLAARNS